MVLLFGDALQDRCLDPTYGSTSEYNSQQETHHTQAKNGILAEHDFTRAAEKWRGFINDVANKHAICLICDLWSDLVGPMIQLLECQLFYCPPKREKEIQPFGSSGILHSPVEAWPISYENINKPET